MRLTAKEVNSRARRSFTSFRMTLHGGFLPRVAPIDSAQWPMILDVRDECDRLASKLMRLCYAIRPM
jgi:hypothetical protein